MKLIYFLLTHNCNLRCRYCFQEKKAGNDNAKKTSREVIDALAEYCGKEKIDNVQLFGGEPLLYKDLFRYCVTTLKRSCPDIQIGLVTNGTLMDAKTLEFVRNNGLGLLLSLDGNRETHDRMRGGFDKILRWAPAFGDKSRISVALQAGRIRGLYRNIKYVWDLDFASGVFVNVINNYGWYTPADVAAFEKEYEKAIKGMLKGEGVLTCALSTFDLMKGYEKSVMCGICALGLASDWGGTLYPCQRAVELGEDFAIGTLWSGVDPEKNLKLRLEIFNSINHSPSSEKYAVASFCPVSVYEKYRTFGGLWGDEFCRIIDLKAKLVAKYYYEIEDYSRQFNPQIPVEVKQLETRGLAG